MSALTPFPASDPRMVAWKAYQATNEYANSRKWALHEEHVEGSLWAAFLAAWELARAEQREADAYQLAEFAHRLRYIFSGIGNYDVSAECLKIADALDDAAAIRSGR